MENVKVITQGQLQQALKGGLLNDKREVIGVTMVGGFNSIEYGKISKILFFNRKMVYYRRATKGATFKKVRGYISSTTPLDMIQGIIQSDNADTLEDIQQQEYIITTDGVLSTADKSEIGNTVLYIEGSYTIEGSDLILELYEKESVAIMEQVLDGKSTVEVGEKDSHTPYFFESSDKARKQEPLEQGSGIIGAMESHKPTDKGDEDMVNNTTGEQTDVVMQFVEGVEEEVREIVENPTVDDLFDVEVEAKGGGFGTGFGGDSGFGGGKGFGGEQLELTERSPLLYETLSENKEIVISISTSPTGLTVHTTRRQIAIHTEHLKTSEIVKEIALSTYHHMTQNDTDVDYRDYEKQLEKIMLILAPKAL